MAKTIVGLYDDVSDAHATVRDLVEHGFEREGISLITRDTRADRTRSVGEEERGNLSGEGAGIGAGAGGLVGALGGLLIGLGALVLPGIGAVVAAGPIVASVAGLAAGAGIGAVVGALIGLGLPEREAQYYAEGIRRGGTLVAVRTTDDRTDEAADIMESHGPTDIHERASGWRREGWSPADPRL